MLRRIVNCSRQGIVSSLRNQSNVATSSENKQKWDLLVGIQVERLPVITKTLNKLEREYQDLLNQIEFERSYKSDFEKREETDMAMAQLLKDGKVKVDLDGVSQQTALDLKDLWKSERSKFQLASRTTEADQKNDIKSIDRKLDHSLTLLVEQQIGKDKLFLLPQGKIAAGETLYDAAQRVIKEFCGDKIQTSIYGKAPCGFYKYKYPKELRGDITGAKVFFYRAILKAGQMDDKCGKFEWLDKTELFNKIDKYDDYKKSLSSFII